MVAAVANLAVTWTEQGRQILLVTPNYDDYLIKAVDEAVRERRATIKLVSETIDWTDFDQELPRKKRTPRKVLRSLAARDRVSVIHFHGVLPEDPRRSSGVGSLVFAEQDYKRSSDRSEILLRALLDAAHFLVIGTGMTDPPLIRSLLSTRDHRKPDLSTAVLMTLQGMVSGEDITEDDLEDLKEILNSRLQHLGVTERIYPDFYFQTLSCYMRSA